MGKDEIGDLADSLQHLLSETAQQASYHSSLSNEIRQTVEHPSAELGMRMSNLKKGLQAAVEKAYKNKGLQEGHVQKVGLNICRGHSPWGLIGLQARDRYEQDCLKLNSYTAQSSLTQGKELEKLHTKLDRVRQTIGANENDFKQFVKVLEITHKKWEQEWKNFCDVSWFFVVDNETDGKQACTRPWRRQDGNHKRSYVGLCQCCVAGVRWRRQCEFDVAIADFAYGNLVMWAD